MLLLNLLILNYYHFQGSIKSLCGRVQVDQDAGTLSQGLKGGREGGPGLDYYKSVHLVLFPVHKI